MGGWLRYLALTAQAKTGFSSFIVVWGVVAAISAAAMLVFLCIAAFVWLADRYDPVTAGLLMAGVFFVIMVIAILCFLWSRQRAIERARLELAARSSASWLDPKLLGIGFQIGQAIGWRRLVSLAAVAILAAGLSKEWLGGGEKPAETDEGRPEE